MRFVSNPEPSGPIKNEAHETYAVRQKSLNGFGDALIKLPVFSGKAEWVYTAGDLLPHKESLNPHMSLKDSPHKEELRAAGWRTRGYLPHFDGRAIPQFITLHLADALPEKVIERWIQQLAHLSDKEKTILLQRRIDRYLDQGYGECHLRNPTVARMVQNALLDGDGTSYKLFSWVVMPNHTHSLSTRFEGLELEEIVRLHKSYTAHEANRLLGREGEFWMKDYFDRYIRNGKHFQNVVRYIENNPVKAGLCKRPEDWPFSSAWFRARGIHPKES